MKIGPFGAMLVTPSFWLVVRSHVSPVKSTNLTLNVLSPSPSVSSRIAFGIEMIGVAVAEVGFPAPTWNRFAHEGRKAPKRPGFNGILLPPLTVAGLLRFVLAVVLLVAAAGKLRAGGPTRAALRSYGISAPWARTALWEGTIAAEIAIAVALVFGITGGAAAGVALFGVFTLALMTAIARGRAGSPCGCLG